MAVSIYGIAATTAMSRAHLPGRHWASRGFGWNPSRRFWRLHQHALAPGLEEFEEVIRCNRIARVVISGAERVPGLDTSASNRQVGHVSFRERLVALVSDAGQEIPTGLIDPVCRRPILGSTAPRLRPDAVQQRLVHESQRAREGCVDDAAPAPRGQAPCRQSAPAAARRSSWSSALVVLSRPPLTYSSKASFQQGKRLSRD